MDNNNNDGIQGEEVEERSSLLRHSLRENNEDASVMLQQHDTLTMSRTRKKRLLFAYAPTLLPGSLVVSFAAYYLVQNHAVRIAPAVHFKATTGFDSRSLIIIGSASNYAFQPLLASFARRYGKHVAITWGTTVLACAYILIALSPNAWWLLLSQVPLGVGGACFALLTTLTFDDIVPRTELGYWRISADANDSLGIALAALAGFTLPKVPDPCRQTAAPSSPAIDKVWWRLPFVVAAAGAIVVFGWAKCGRPKRASIEAGTGTRMERESPSQVRTLVSGSSLFLATMLSLLTLNLARKVQYGCDTSTVPWTRSKVVATCSLGAAAVLLICFVAYRESRSRDNPALPWSSFAKSRPMICLTFAISMVILSQAMVTYSLADYIQIQSTDGSHIMQWAFISIPVGGVVGSTVAAVLLRKSAHLRHYYGANIVLAFVLHLLLTAGVIAPETVIGTITMSLFGFVLKVSDQLVVLALLGVIAPDGKSLDRDRVSAEKYQLLALFNLAVSVTRDVGITICSNVSNALAWDRGSEMQMNFSFATIIIIFALAATTFIPRSLRHDIAPCINAEGADDGDCNQDGDAVQNRHDHGDTNERHDEQPIARTTL